MSNPDTPRRLSAEEWEDLNSLLLFQGECRTHGIQRIVESGENPGFGGEYIEWDRLACGCTLMTEYGDPMAGIR